MTMDSVRDRLLDELNHLTPVQQEKLLDYARQMQQGSTLPPGTPGKIWLAKMDEFEYDPEAVNDMMRAIDEDCERIDWDGWQ
jgi:hypothetical protein